MIVIARYSFPHQALLAKSSLEVAGIPCFIADEYTINMQWLYSDAMGGVRLFVEEADVEKALEVLNTDYSEAVDAFVNKPNFKTELDD